MWECYTSKPTNPLALNIGGGAIHYNLLTYKHRISINTILRLNKLYHSLRILCATGEEKVVVGIS